MKNTLFAISFLLVACNDEPPAPLPVANFFVDNNNCLGPCYVYFYDQSLNAVKWEYDFDNGFTSEVADDSSQYYLQNTYTIKLKVWNEDNEVDSVQKEIFVYE